MCDYIKKNSNVRSRLSFVLAICLKYYCGNVVIHNNIMGGRVNNKKIIVLFSSFHSFCLVVFI